MHVRRCDVSDLPAAAELASDALRVHAIFDFLCPGRYQYPNDFRDNFKRRMTARYYTPGWHLWVAVTDAEDEGEEEEKIVGYAAWERRGDGENAKKWREIGWLQGIWCHVQRFIATTHNRIINALGWDRSIDQVALLRFDEYAKSKILQSVSPEMWYLATMAVHTAHQGRGIGGKLLSWGLDRATEENVPVGLEASEAGVRLYEKVGFQTIEGWEWCEGLLPTPIMVWEPEGLTAEESWIKRGKRLAEDKKTV